MRLIDADELKVTEGIFTYAGEEYDCISPAAYRVKEINNAPTVEAIPIEWIKHYKSIYGLTYSTLNNLLGTMLEDWKEENA